MEYTCHSGGAIGSDMMWETEGGKYGVTTITYSFPGHDTNSSNSLILTPNELSEGWDNILIANETLQRKVNTVTNVSYIKNLLSRNWFQVKNSTTIFAVGFFAGKTRTHISGGTGWAVQMAKDNNKPIYFFDQHSNAWFLWSFEYNKFLQYFSKPVLTENFAGIGTRDLNELGKNAIIQIYKNTFE